MIKYNDGPGNLRNPKFDKTNQKEYFLRINTDILLNRLGSTFPVSVFEDGSSPTSLFKV